MKDIIVEALPVAVYAVDTEGHITFYNSAAAALWGRRPDCGTERWCGSWRLHWPDGRSMGHDECPMATAMKDQKCGSAVDVVIEQPTGSRVAVTVQPALLHDSSGAVSGGVNVLIVKEDQKNAALERSRLAAIVEGSDDAIISKTLDGLITSWNAGATRIFGYRSEEMINQSVMRLIPDHLQAEEANIVATLKSGGRVDHFETLRVGKDGKLIEVSLTVSPLYDDLGHVVGASKIARNITERRALDERLRQSQKLEAVGQLTGGVAHDFNNLLTVILGNAEALTESLSHDQQLRLLAEMTATAAERAAELTKRLLAFSRRQALEPKVVNVNRLLAGMDMLLRRTLAEDIAIEIVGTGGLWEALIDPGQLEGAVLNLAINARDAMPDGGRLTIETANAALDDKYARAHSEVDAGQYVMLSVSDTGTGMDANTLARAFEPFFTTKEIGKGSGLGLSMVYGFVKQSHGHVKIYSEPGHGTSVKLYLPRASAIADGLDAALDKQQPPAKGTEKILLVEDDDLVRQHVVGQLTSLGYRVVGVCNGPEAIEALCQIADFDLLFTDVVMPGGFNGRQLADKANSLRPGLPVLFTSGYTENAILHHGHIERGMYLLNKPYRKQELAAKIRLVLDETRRRAS